MIRVRPAAAAGVACAAIGLSAWVNPLPAQSMLGLGRGGEVGGSFDGQRFAYGAGRASGGTDYRAWFNLPLAGMLVSPGFLSYQANLQPTLVWQQRTGFGAVQRLRQLNLAFSGSLFSGHTASLTANGANNSSISSGGLGGRRDYTTALREVQLWARFRPLPIRVSYSRHALDETWSNPGGSEPIRTASVERTLRFSAASSKLTLQGQRYEHDDLLRDLDYTLTSFQGVHVFRWGRGSRLESAFEAADQQGLFAYRRREWRERLELYHSARVRTEYYLTRYADGNESGPVRSNTLGGIASVGLGRGVSVGAVVGRSRSSHGAARDRLTSLSPRASFSFGRREGFQAAGNAAVGAEWRRVEGASGLVAVVNEVHDVPASRLITLDQPDAQRAPIVLTNADGSVTYLEGPDYEVRPLDREIQLRIPPSSRIEVGGRLLVSYRYRVLVEGASAALRVDAGVSLSYRGLALRHQRSERRTGSSPLGQDGAPGGSPSDFEEARTELSLRSSTPAGRLDVAASLRTRERLSDRTTDQELSTSYSPPRFGRIDATLFGVWSSTGTANRRQAGTSLSAGASWPVSRRLLLGATVESSALSQSDGPTQRYVIGRVTTGWHLERMALDLSLDLYRQNRPQVRSTGRLSVRLARQL